MLTGNPVTSMDDTPAAAFKIAFVLLSDFSNLGLAAAVEPLSVANWLTNRQVFEWRFLSLDGHPVRASNGMSILVETTLENPQEYAAIIVAASFNAAAHAQNTKLLNWLRRAARFGVKIGAIETGAEVLAAAGLLNDHTAAVHWYNLDGFRQRYPSVSATGARFTADRDRMTCAGGITSIDMVLALIATHANKALADEVALHLFVQDQAKSVYAPAVQSAERSTRAADSIMRETLENPLTCRHLAARVGLSDRQLQRHFRTALGVGVAQHYVRLRLERAHKYVQLTELSVTEIALACGFGSIEHFSRSYRRAFGVAPKSDRSQTKAGSVFRVLPQQGNELRIAKTTQSKNI